MSAMVCKCFFSAVVHTGGTSQEGKRPKNWEFFLYLLGSLDQLYIFAFLEIVICLKHIEASHIMEFNS